MKCSANFVYERQLGAQNFVSIFKSPAQDNDAFALIDFQHLFARVCVAAPLPSNKFRLVCFRVLLCMRTDRVFLPLLNSLRGELQ